MYRELEEWNMASEGTPVYNECMEEGTPMKETESFRWQKKLREMEVVESQN